MGKHDAIYFIKGKYPEKYYPMEKRKAYAFVDSMDIPFTIPAEAVVPLEAYTSPTMLVYCDVRVSLYQSSFSLSQDMAWLAVQQLSPPPRSVVPLAERHWMTVADLGESTPSHETPWRGDECSQPRRGRGRERQAEGAGRERTRKPLWRGASGADMVVVRLDVPTLIDAWWLPAWRQGASVGWCSITLSTT